MPNSPLPPIWPLPASRLWSRRAVLGTLATGALAAYAVPRWTKALSGKPFGAFPDWAKALALPANLQAKRVLEVFLTGGLSPWETLYCIDKPNYGKTDGLMYWTFESGKHSWQPLLNQCYPSVSATPLPFAFDAVGTLVGIGPLAGPLRQRPDLLARLRLHVLSHNLFPHHPAQHLSATGAALGSPTAVGMAAAVERYASENLGSDKTPHAWLVTVGLPFDGIVRTGELGSVATPMVINLQQMPDFSAAMLAQMFDEPEVMGKLRALSRKALIGQLTWPAGAQVRSGALAGVQSAEAGIPKLGAAITAVPPAMYATTPGSVCLGTASQEAYSADWTQQRFKLANQLLQFAGNETMYVGINESGYSEQSPMPEGLDFHADFSVRAVRRYPHVFAGLCQSLAKPSDTASGKIDLDSTLVIINTEFGRSPGPQDITGRNHYPTAYVTGMLGGPVGAAQKGIVGAIDANAQPVKPLKPSDIRCAALYALGIWPFEQGLYAYTDVSGAVSEQDAIVRLRTQVLGVPT